MWAERKNAEQEFQAAEGITYDRSSARKATRAPHIRNLRCQCLMRAFGANCWRPFPRYHINTIFGAWGQSLPEVALCTMWWWLARVHR